MSNGNDILCVYNSNLKIEQQNYSSTILNDDTLVVVSNEPKKPKSTFNFGKCKICKDKATGVHYGIASCEGCKGFFKRSIQKHHKYICYFGNKCVITPNQRKRCKYCRWRSCLEAGMSFDGIKMGRIPKIEREKAKFKNENSSTDDSDSEDRQDFYVQKFNQEELNKNSYALTESLKKLLNLNPSADLMNSLDLHNLMPKTCFTDLCITTANENFMFFLSMVKDKCYQLFIENTIDHRKSYSLAMTTIKKGLNFEMFHFNKLNKLSDEDLWNNFCREFSSFTRKLVSTLQKLPGFDKFNFADISKIVSQRLFSVYGFGVTKLFINNELYSVLDGGNICFNRFTMEKCLGDKITEKIFNYHNRLNSLNLTDYELAILVPWTLCSSEIDLIENQELFKELRKFYTQVLFYEFSLNYRGPEFFNDLIKIIDAALEFDLLIKQAPLKEENESV